MHSDIDNAIMNLDKDKIIEICTKNNLTIPDDEISFWGAIHKARLYVPYATAKQKEESKKWLIDHDLIPKLIREM